MISFMKNYPDVDFHLKLIERKNGFDSIDQRPHLPDGPVGVCVRFCSSVAGQKI